MNEHGFIRKIHKALPSGLYHWKIHAAFNNGIPDAWYSAPGISHWVEYKWVAHFPKRPNTIVDFRDTSKSYALSLLQQRWLRDRNAEGQRVSVIAGFEDKALIFPGSHWDRAYTANQLLEQAVTFNNVLEYLCQSESNTTTGMFSETKKVISSSCKP